MTQPVLSLEDVSKTFGPSRRSGPSVSRSVPTRSSASSARTAPASQHCSRCCPASTNRILASSADLASPSCWPRRSPPKRSGSAWCTRSSRCCPTSRSPRTFSSAERSVPSFGRIRWGAMHAEARRQRRKSTWPTIPVCAPAAALRRPPDGRARQGAGAGRQPRRQSRNSARRTNLGAGVRPRSSCSSTACAPCESGRPSSSCRTAWTRSPNWRTAST